MADYSMLADGDRVLIAVSGGIDSLVLARVLQLWITRAPLTYVVHGVHIDMQPEKDEPGPIARRVQATLQHHGLSCTILPAAWTPDEEAVDQGRVKDVCFQCARSRRTQLFSHAWKSQYHTLALGHHRDDIIETFFLNMLHAGNLSTMVPKQQLFSGRLSIIRPLAYLSKKQVQGIGRDLSLQPIRSNCPLSEQTSRCRVHEIINDIEQQLPGAREHIFAALANIRPDYLLDRQYRNDHANRS